MAEMGNQLRTIGNFLHSEALRFAEEMLTNKPLIKNGVIYYTSVLASVPTGIPRKLDTNGFSHIDEDTNIKMDETMPWVHGVPVAYQTFGNELRNLRGFKTHMDYYEALQRKALIKNLQAAAGIPARAYLHDQDAMYAEYHTVKRQAETDKIRIRELEGQCRTIQKATQALERIAGLEQQIRYLSDACDQEKKTAEHFKELYLRLKKGGD